MGIVNKTVKVKWNGRNKKYYESLGYEYTKLGDEFEVKVEDLSNGNNSKVEIECDCCRQQKQWRYADYTKRTKNGKTYCRKCARKLYGGKKMQKTKLQNSKSFYDWCIENDRQDILDRWDYELNNYSPNEIGYGSHEKCWFKCLDHPEHKSELKSINDFTNNKIPINCKQCNSIAQWFIDNDLDINLYWDYDKNTINPWEISYGSNVKIWIKCQEKDYHGSYEISCANFSSGYRCPYCSSRKIHLLDSLKQYITNSYGEEFFNKIWSNKNSINPTTISPNSSKRCWWNCPEGKHEPYKRSCNDSNKKEYRCPNCVKDRKESIIEEKVRLYLEELGYKIKTEYNCTIIPKNPKTKQLLPFDNEIILSNGKHLIIEVHGEQHYKSHFYKTKYKCNNKEAEQMLYKRKLYDRYKRIKCIQAGCEYLELPYTAFNKKETYKNLIDNKIKEILDK